jgi:signal transduction histidine kinase
VQSQQNSIDSLKRVFAITKTDTGRARLATELSSTYFAINQDSAIYYSSLSVQWAGSSKNQELELESRLKLADILSERDIPKSMKEYFKALQLAEKINDKKHVALCYESIGLLYLYLGNGNTYIDYLQKAIVIYKKLNDLSGIINCYSEIGGAHSNPDSARYYLNLAAKDSTNFNSAYYNYYWGNNETDPQKARAFFLKSIGISEKEKDYRGLSLASRWLSIFYQKNGDLDSGILAAKKGLYAAQQINLPRGIINNSEQLTIIYKNLNLIDSAYKYQTIMVAAKDRLFSHDKINQIQNSIIEEQQRVQHLQEEKNTFKYRIKLGGALGIALVLLLLTLIFYRNHRKSQQSNFLLQSQREEIDKKNFELQQSLDTLKSTQAQLIHSEKMASLGVLTAGIAHEIQNPLNFVNNFSEVNKELIEEMKGEIDSGNLKEAKTIANAIEGNEEKIIFHGKRADSIVKGMLQHSRSRNGIKEPTDINVLADEFLRLAYHGLRAKDKSFNASMKTDLDDTIGKINVAPQDIGRVILNLLNNAFYAVIEKKNLGIEGYEPVVTISTKRLGDKVEIKVSDNGNGIPSQVMDKIFQPFFTTKPAGQGTGLGLSLSYDIITKGHGGELTVQTMQGEGSTFTIQLPV